MSALSKARCKPGRTPAGRQHNAVLNHLLANRLLKPVEVQGSAEAAPHPWRVQTSRFESNDHSTLDPSSTWRIDVADGYVNDQPATILYQRSADPRGWQLPDGYVELSALNSQLSTPWIDRTALDDPDDPPYLVIPDPPSSATASANPTSSAWAQIPDNKRLGIEAGAFCGASDWDLELWRAHVIVSASPFAAVALNPKLPPPRLTRYRLYTQARLPNSTFGSNAGGWAELATLYLLRDPADPQNTAEVRVRQRDPYGFYDLWAMIITPGSDLVALLGDAGILIAGDVASGTFTAWWSV